jgi:Zn-dependent protease
VPDAAIDRAAADIPLTRTARDELERAGEAARNRGDAEPRATDVLVAVLGDRGSLAGQTLRSLGVDPAAFGATLWQNGAATAPGPPLRQLLVNANREAQVLGHYQVDSIHLLLALLYTDSPATSAPLQKAGVSLYDVRNHMQTGAAAGASAGVRPGTRRPPDKALRRRPWPTLRGAVGVSPLFLGIVALAVVSGALLWINPFPQGIGALTLVFVVAAWVASVCVHEFFHAVVAYLGGDRTVAVSGYLNLNPLKYTHIVMSIVFPVVFLLAGGIALPGGAVYIDRGLLRSKWWDSAVSLAGPVGTLVCGLFGAALWVVLVNLQLVNSTNVVFFEALAFYVFVQMFSLIGNLIPLPPLDGFGIIRPWLPYGVQAAANRIAGVGIVLFFVAIWYIPPALAALSHSAGFLTSLVGVDLNAAAEGQFNMPRLR